MSVAEGDSGSALVADLLTTCDFAPPGTAVDCAVSGGADSLALLALAVAADLDVTAWHVDHGLRPGSAADFDVVVAAADRFGVPARRLTVSVGAGPNLEARARQARFAALPNGVLTGHTADDQAETVLLGLIRGSGLHGLAGMRRPGHPLLALRRRDTEAVCAALGLSPVADPTNLSPVHRRNRIRHEVIPLLSEVADRDVAALVARQCTHLADDADLLDHLAADIDPTDPHALSNAPIALGRRAVRRWLTSEYPPDAAAVDRVLSVARGERRATEVGGRRVWRSHGTMYAESSSPVGPGGPQRC